MLWLSSPSFRDYEISENGDVRHRESGRIKAQTIMPSGYHTVTLRRAGETKMVKVHRLVCDCRRLFAPHACSAVQHQQNHDGAHCSW